MIGVHNTAANWDQFLITLEAGIYISLFLGLLVGLLLLWFERRLDRRSEQQQYEREVTTFQERLRFVFNQPYSTNLDEIIESPPPVKAIGELIANSPVELWRHNVPKQQKFFKVLNEFQQSYSNFTTVTNSLLASARIIIRNYNYQLGKVSDYDSAGQLYFLGRILGFESKVILPWLWIGATSVDQLPYFETIYNLLLPNGEEIDLVSQYKNARTRLGESTEKLKKALLSESFAQ